MANTLVGLFDDRDVAQTAVQDLIDAGVSREGISIVAADASGEVTTSTVDSDGNLAGEGAASGLSSGAVVGGVAGLLIGAGFTVLPIAGFLLAGPIAGLIAGAAAGAATGGILGGLIGLGIPDDQAEYYAEGVRRGGTLVTVNTENADEGRVRDILNRDGAVNIEERGAAYRSQGFTSYDQNAKPYTSAEITAERNRYATPINNDWNDTTSAPAPSADATYGTPSTMTTGSTAGTDFTGERLGTDLNGHTSGGGWDDTEDRNHFQRNNPGGDYEEHAPAYAYGRRIANDPTYAGADFDTNESIYREDWERERPGTWDRFKGSVREAYRSVREKV